MTSVVVSSSIVPQNKPELETKLIGAIGSSKTIDGGAVNVVRLGEDVGLLMSNYPTLSHDEQVEADDIFDTLIVLGARAGALSAQISDYLRRYPPSSKI